MLLTLKKTLGVYFTSEVQRAWVMAFSWFFIVSFPLLPTEKVVYIKAASSPPKFPLAAPGVSTTSFSKDKQSPPKPFVGL